VAVFFRHTDLSDRIGFAYQGYEDPEAAARDFVSRVRDLAARLPAGDDRVLTVILDGENAWGGYRDDGRPFLHALYRALARDPAIRTVTPSEYLDGSPARRVDRHPLAALARVHDLATGSWIDEAGSGPGVDLGTWIGEPEENRGWELLGRARADLFAAGTAAAGATEALESIYAAQGSDWFWWLGEDQDSGRDHEFDDLFRAHLRASYRVRGAEPPVILARALTTRVRVWSFTEPIPAIQPGDRLAIQTNCPGVLTWRAGEADPREAPLTPVGGVMGGSHRHRALLGPLAAGPVRFRFRCTHPGCGGGEACCSTAEALVRVE
jgi:alpha-amylase/alpha-mannosidase (GH57 family)